MGGIIDIGCIPTILGDYIPQAVQDYKELKNPKAVFNIYQDHTLHLLDGLKRGKYDIAFCSKTEDPELEFVPILAQRLVLVVRKDHPLAEREEVCLKELTDYPLTTYRETLPIGRPSGPCCGNMVWNAAFLMMMRSPSAGSSQPRTGGYCSRHSLPKTI